MQVNQPFPTLIVTWSWTGTAIIIGACLLCLLLFPGRFAILTPEMQIPLPSLFNNPSIGSFLASMSAGHIIGIGAVLSLNIPRYS